MKKTKHSTLQGLCNFIQLMYVRNIDSPFEKYRFLFVKILKCLSETLHLSMTYMKADDLGSIKLIHVFHESCITCIKRDFVDTLLSIREIHKTAFYLAGMSDRVMRPRAFSHSHQVVLAMMIAITPISVTEITLRGKDLEQTSISLCDSGEQV